MDILKEAPERRLSFGRKAVIAIGAFGLAALGIADQINNNEDMGQLITRPEAFCEIPLGATHDYTFKPGDGINEAVFSVRGVGKGTGEVCFDSIDQKVRVKVEQQNQYGDNPHAGQTIKDLPDYVIPHYNK